MAQPLDLSYNEVMMCLRMFENVMEDNEGVREVLAKIVPTYKRPEQDKVEVG